MKSINHLLRSTQENDSKRIIPVLNRYFLFLLISVCAVACQWEETPPYQTPQPVTEILRVEYTPMQIHTGDSVTFKVVIRDSLRTDLLFEWYFGRYPLLTVNTKDARVLFDHVPGEYPSSVRVFLPHSTTQSVSKTFLIEVLP